MNKKKHEVKTPISPHRIPQMAFIEAQIVHRAVRAGVLEQTVRAVELDYNLPLGALGNGVFFESRAVTLLYCLIVLPKEIWRPDEKHGIYAQIAAQWTLEDVIVSKHEKDFEKRPIYLFIHHLRNAVSHANFTFENSRFGFWDRRQQGDLPSFEASLSFVVLEHFLEIVGALLANLRTYRELKDNSRPD